MKMNIVVAISHNTISIVTQLFAIFVFGQIVLPGTKISKVIQFNVSIKLYMYSTISFCILSIPLEIYYYFVWPDEKLMNPYWVWWAGMIQSMTLMAIPITVLFLSIDRCLIIALPNSECKRKPFIIGLTIVSILVACGVSLWYDDLEPYIKIPDRIDELSICRDFTCLLQRASVTVYLVIKLFITFAIVIVGIICCLLIRKNLVGTSTHASLNKIIFFTLLNTVIFDIGPYFIDLILWLGFKINLNDILGPYRTALGALDAGICAFSYYKVISRRMNAAKTTPLGTSKREASVYKIVNAIKKNNWVNSTVNQ